MNKRVKQRERQGADGCADLGAGWLRRLLSVCPPVPGDLSGRIAKQLAKRRDEVRDMAVTRVLGGLLQRDAALIERDYGTASPALLVGHSLGGLLTLDAVARDSGQFQG